MSGTTFKLFVKELEQFGSASMKRRSTDTAKKEKALLLYKRMQFKKAGKKLTPRQDEELVKSVKARFSAQAPKPNVDMLSYLDSSTNSVDRHHTVDIALFLRSQRVYEELLERYNPGISMKQTDKVRKTARRVGLEVPE